MPLLSEDYSLNQNLLKTVYSSLISLTQSRLDAFNNSPRRPQHMTYPASLRGIIQPSGVMTCTSGEYPKQSSAREILFDSGLGHQYLCKYLLRTNPIPDLDFASYTWLPSGVTACTSGESVNVAIFSQRHPVQFRTRSWIYESVCKILFRWRQYPTTTLPDLRQLCITA